ncbi:hypothetical protein [Streptomyces scopuliridis]|uniref:hypothetical protein n=1 Tax=Streptomyces scopuliridis TaxID=452529 RepID=UPI003F55F793
MTGAEGLAHHADLIATEWLAVGRYAFLVAVWAVTGFRTPRGLRGGAPPQELLTK